MEYLNNKAFEGIIKRFQMSKQEKNKYELIIGDLNKSKENREKRKKPGRKSIKVHHLTELLNKKLELYKEIKLDFIESQNALADAFYTLSRNIVNYAKFQGIDDDDAVQEGVVICFEKVDRFNPEYIGKNGQKAKAFNYMTTCILNHFRQLYRTARNYQELKKKYLNYLQFELEKIIIHNGKIHSNTSDSTSIPIEGNRGGNGAM
jgi:hypothetical protein